MITENPTKSYSREHQRHKWKKKITWQTCEKGLSRETEEAKQVICRNTPECQAEELDLIEFVTGSHQRFLKMEMAYAIIKED